MHPTSGPTFQYAGGGAFFTDASGTTLYSLGGFSPDKETGDYSVEAFNILSGSWSDPTVSGGPFNRLDRSQSMFAQTQAGGMALGFMAGGVNPVPGMLTFNASNLQELSWENSTSNDIPFFWGPATEYVRFGNKGVLVSVGGYAFYNSSQRGQRDMSAVQVYDIDSQTWFEINATGDIPPDRSSFCSGLSSARDDSSFQMTVHGGYNLEGNAVLSDIHVLTMPAFRWIKIQDGSDKDKQNLGPRRRHLCNVYRDRQMFVLGGDRTNEVKCDASTPPIRLLDTSTFNFQSSYPTPNATYKIPPQVYNVIGGDANGGATKKVPEGSFTSTNKTISITAIFSKRVARSDHSSGTLASNTDTTSSAGSSPSGSAGQTAAPKSNHKGAIAGSVVGGIVGLTLITAAATYLWRKQRQRSTPEWQKPELSAEERGPSLAEPKPAGYKSQELPGEDTEIPRHAELNGVVQNELDAGPTAQRGVWNEMPS